MGVFTLFQASLYLLVALAGAMLGYAEGHADGRLTPQHFTPLLVAVAFFVVDRFRTWSLPVTVAGALGLIAFGISIGEIIFGSIEARLTSGAHLVTYLTWILLFLKKQEREYWVLLAFTVLMVALSGVLDRSEALGAQIFLFLLLAIWTLSLLTLHSARQRFARAEAIGLHRRIREEDFTDHRHFMDRSSEVRGAVQQDPEERWIGWRFVTGYAFSVVVVLMLAGVFYVSIPRVWIGKWSYGDEAIAATARTGYSDQLNLLGEGIVRESTRPVMFVRLSNPRTGERISMEDYLQRTGQVEPLFRGSVNDNYFEGRWSGIADGRSTSNIPREIVTRVGEEAVRQEIELRPISSRSLPAMHPVNAGRILSSPGAILFQSQTARLLHSVGGRTDRVLKYQIDSLLPRTDDRNDPFTMRTRQRSRLYPPTEIGLQFPDRLDRVAALARSLVQPEPGALPLSSREKMRRLENYLRSEGGFTYTLNIKREDPNADPIEDFLFNRKTGHCEYYASALALMLRGVDVPTRLVNGFKGGVSNPTRDAFEVQERHAHAWVEAWSDDDRVWVVLDPTPAAARAASISEIGNSLSPWAAAKEFFSSVWNGQILTLDLSEQKRKIYQPIRDLAVSWWNTLSGGEDLQRLWKRFLRFLSRPEDWISIQGGIFTFVLLIVLSGLVWIAKQVRLLWRRFRGRRTENSRGRIEFYERFREITERFGYRRPTTQTQREFADRFAEQIVLTVPVMTALDLPQRLTEAFYRIRFGGTEPSAEELRSLHADLDRFETELAAPAAASPSIAPSASDAAS